MNKQLLKFFSLFLMLSLIATPGLAQTISGERNEPPSSEDVERLSKSEPERLPQEILDEFEGGMSIEEFLIKNQGPIPNALVEYADMPVTIVVQLQSPSLIEYVKQKDINTRSAMEQEIYLTQLKSQQAKILSEIKTSRSNIIQIGENFTKVLNGFMLRVPAKSINDIRQIPGVKSVNRAPEYQPTLSASAPLINADDVWNYYGLDIGYTGKEVTIAVIDTGIDYTHAMFGGTVVYNTNDPDIIEPNSFPTAKVIGGYDFAGSNYDASGQNGSPIPIPDPDPLDENGHGTHVASTAAGMDIGFGSGIAPDALLYALKIFGVNGSTNLTLQAIEWAMDPQNLGHLGEPVDVINMSLGSNWGPADENDPEFIAIENASAIGVTVIASAGNAGDNSYIVGSPSVADSAISVAASTTGYYAPFIEYTTTETHFIPYTTSDNPITTKITGELSWAGGITNTDKYLCDISTVTGTPLLDKIALISRGGEPEACSFVQKINNADTLGAVAAIIYNNVEGIFGMFTEGSILPAASILQSDGETLAGLSPISISIGPDSDLKLFESDPPLDTIADFSSRGPRGFDSKLKPEITAPGVSIFAANMGSETGGVNMSGTSMAAPHIAGVAALLKEAQYEDPTHIKAALMNTAVDLADPLSTQIPRQGAGRVDAFAAVDTNVIAYADPNLISLSWGVIEVKEDYSDTQTITLQNFSITDDIEFSVNAYFVSDDTGATLTIPTTPVTVPANLATSVEVTLNLTAAQLPILFNNPYYGNSMEEYYGFITFTNTGVGGEELRVPFYFVPRPYTEIAEINSVTYFEVNDFGFASLEQYGPVSSSLWSLPVSLVSGNSPYVLDSGDLRYVGLDYIETHDLIIPAFAMWGDAHTNHHYFNEVNMYIDADRDGNYETVNFNNNYSYWDGSEWRNIWVVIQRDFTDGKLYLGSPYLIFADFNSGIQEWYLPPSYNYVTDTFDYDVFSYDWNGTVDYAGTSSFDITKRPLVSKLTNYYPNNENFELSFRINDWYGYDFSNIQGLMLVDYHGKPGAGQSYYWPLDLFFSYYVPYIMH